MNPSLAHSLRFICLSFMVAVGVWLAAGVNGFTSEDSEEGGMPLQDRMDLAWKQEFDFTHDPKTNTVPRERLYAAYQYSLSLQNTIQRMASPFSGLTWKERGPSNIAGRSRSVLVSSLDPSGQTVFSAGIGGGLWKTTNIASNTPNWTPVNDFFANIAITTIAQDPSNGNILYFGTGEGWANSDAIRGDGIWKSIDGGTTFTQMSGTGSNTLFNYINKIVVHPLTGDVYAATNSGLLRYSASVWTKVLGASAGAAINFIADVEISANNTIYACTGNYGSAADGIYKSASGNNGTYSKLNTVASGFPTSGFSRIEIACAPSNASVLYAMAHNSVNNKLLGIYKSTNAGVTWSLCTLPVDSDTDIGNDITRAQAWYDMTVAVDPSNASTLITGGIDLFRSVNSGTSWTQLSHWYGGFGYPYVHGDQHAIVYRNSNEVYFANDGGIYKSINGGATINFSGTNFNVTQFYSCAINPLLSSNQFLAGAQDNGSQKFSIPGINTTTEATGGDGTFCHIDQLNSDLQFTGYVFNSVYRSTDGGNNFTNIRNLKSGLFINPSDFDNINKVFYAAYDNGMYSYLTNAGTSTTWVDVSVSVFSGAKVTAITCSPTTPNRVFFGTSNGRVVRADNAQTTTPTFTTINSGVSGMLGSGGATVSCIDVESDDDNHLLVTYSNYGWTSVWEKKPSIAWAAVEGNLPDMPIRWCMFNPIDSASALIATELGVWSTDSLNASNTIWLPANNGMANVRTDMFQLRTSDKMIIAATHGRGLYSTDYFAAAYVDFVSDKQVAYINTPIKFKDGSVKATSWNWDFGDATSSTLQHPQKLYASPGVYTVALKINGNNLLTKTITGYITVLPDRGTPYTLTAGGNFENNPNDFAATTTGRTFWQRGNSAVTGKNGVRSGSVSWVTNLTSNYTNNVTAILYTPNFVCSTMGTYTLSFYRKNDFEIGYDGLKLEYSLNKGASWNTLGSVGTNWYDYPNTSGSAFPSGQPYFNALKSSYTLASLDVSFLAGFPNVAFRFVFKSDALVNQPGVAIDDFILLGPINTVPAATLSLNLKFFLQGFYSGLSTMQPVLFNSGVSTNSLLTDSVTLELHNATAPFATAFTQKRGLSPDGTSSFSLPTSLSGNTYYIVLKHRNHLETWSKNPITLSSYNTYDFSVAFTVSRIGNPFFGFIKRG